MGVTLRRNIFPALLVLMITLSVSTLALRCRKGFNLSFSGIPLFYLWMDGSCDVGTRCMIQDLSLKSTIVNHAYGNLTYGGCFPETVQRRMSCATSNDPRKHITSDELDEIGRGLDKMVAEVMLDLVLHAKEHLATMFSFGNGNQDLQNGILDLLESVGYDKTKIRHSLHRWIQDFTNSEKFMHFVKALQVECDATNELSASMLHHLKVFAHKRNIAIIPSYVARTTEIIPRLIYPIVKSAVDDVDTLFHEASNMFNSPDHTSSEATCTGLAIGYVLTNGVLAEWACTDGSGCDEMLDLLSVATKDITRRCLTAYPDNERIERMDFFTDKCFSILKTAAKCNADTLTCKKAKMEAQRKISLEFFELQKKKGSIQSSEFMYIVQDFNSVYSPALQELQRDRHRLLTTPVTFVIDRTRKQLLRYINFLHDNGEEVMKDYNVESACEEYLCNRSLCNSFANFKRHTMTNEGSTSTRETKGSLP